MGTKAFNDAVAVLTVEYDEFEATKIASLLAHKGLLKDDETNEGRNE